MDAKRGYVPEDEKNFSSESIEKLKIATKHVIYLINEGYDVKSATTFVGNHFVLSERQRFLIARSVSTTKQLDIRKAKEKASIEGEEVWIDGFNTIITLEVMFSNSILYEGMDGTTRDLAALRGTYKIIPETTNAVEMLLNVLKEKKIASAHILLDEPVSNSGRLKSLIAEISENHEIKPDIRILKDVDRTLYEKDNVITSDAVILNHCKSWCNIMKPCMEKYGVKPLRVW